MNDRKQLILANGFLAITIAILLGLAALFSTGCHDMDDGEFELEDDTATGFDVNDTFKTYWVVIEDATIPAHKVATDDYLPDPWAAIYRGGDQMGTTASCDMETYDPEWGDHMFHATVAEFISDTWTISLYDYELEPSGNNHLGACFLNATPTEIEHGIDVHLFGCTGAVERIHVRFELYTGPIDVESEKNPNC